MNYTTLFIILILSIRYIVSIKLLLTFLFLKISIQKNRIENIRSRIGVLGIIKMGWRGFIYKITKKSVEIDRKYCTISYYHEGITYKVKFKRNRISKSIISIIDENGQDVQNKILTYIGIGKNFHSIPTTPEMLGYKTLIFTMIDGEEIKYENNELINI